MNAQTKLTALSVDDLVRLLRQSGSRTVSRETIESQIAAGVPCNPDGTINLFHYVAFLLESTE
ncbi:MAG: hypothetical protein WCI51_02195 [Lentisphaerota bacterium]